MPLNGFFIFRTNYFNPHWCQRFSSGLLKLLFKLRAPLGPKRICLSHGTLFTFSDLHLPLSEGNMVYTVGNIASRKFLAVHIAHKTLRSVKV